MYNDQSNNSAPETQVVGFSWGYTLSNDKPSAGTDRVNTSVKPINSTANKNHELGLASNNTQARLKRNYENDNDNNNYSDMATSISNSNSTNQNNSGLLLRKYMVVKKKPNMISNANNLSSIQGQFLPVERSLELMEKSQLQDVILGLLNVHPQISQYLNSKISQFSFSNEKRLESLRYKLQEIYSNIPYNKDYLNNIKTQLDDYAFVRLKPLILEFLNCLTDYILNNIPPRTNNLQESLLFLDLCTEMVTQLPRFQLPSNNYYYDKCLEQLSCIWCTLIEHISKDDSVLFFNDKSAIIDIYEKLKNYNNISNNLLLRPLQLFKHLGMISTEENSTTSAHTSYFNIVTPDNRNTF